MIWTIWVALGSLFGGLAVAFGAFGAHALKGRLSEEALQWFDTAARYQSIHALALIAIGLVAIKIDTVWIKTAGAAMTLGILIFSGSLYALALTGIRTLGAVTPIGGVALMIGWFTLCLGVLFT